MPAVSPSFWRNFSSCVMMMSWKLEWCLRSLMMLKAQLSAYYRYGTLGDVLSKTRGKRSDVLGIKRVRGFVES